MMTPANHLPDTKGWEVNLLALDPGGNVGVSIITIDFHTRAIIRTEAISLNMEKSQFFLKEQAKVTTVGEERLRALAVELTDLLYQYRPVQVYCESPFFSSFTASAFESLNRVLLVIKQCLYDFNDAIPFYKVDPPTAKKAIGAKGNAKKDDMLIALEKQRHVLKLETPTEELTEHSVDACAIGYWGYSKHAKKGMFQ